VATVPDLLGAGRRPPAPSDPADDHAEAEGQVSGAVAVEVKPKARIRRVATLGEATKKSHKLSLPDSVFDRLQLTANQRRKTVSAVAAENLDRNLPKIRIEREG
jgi:hypothetical protein